MPPPTTRTELTQGLETAFEKLAKELRGRDAAFGARIAVDDWTVRDVLAIRAWWAERVVEWIEAGQRGETFPLPAEGFRWNETPRLNAEVVARSQGATLAETWLRLEEAIAAVHTTIDSLTDTELFEVEIFSWAERWPVSRWLAINSTRQLTTARTLIRKAARG